MASSKSPTKIAEREQMQPRQIPVLDTTQPGVDPLAPQDIPYLDQGVQYDAKYQVQWRNWMSDGQEKSTYKHVFVLLLSWDPECDDLAVHAEVKQLENVFQNTYNYNVTAVLIDSRLPKLPQIQANSAVANFVSENDQEDSLFIVYYAGHGSAGKGPGDLNLSGRRRQEDMEISQQFSHIAWNDVEANLKTTRADVLLVFDCCHASDLGRESVLKSRCFEYLAASTSSYTRSPGRQSFTTALIWALTDLAPKSNRVAPSESPMFTTSKLAKRICDCPDFPKDQKPSLTTRDIDAHKHIILAPLLREGVPAIMSSTRMQDKDQDEVEDEDSKPLRQFLSLTFRYKRKQTEAEFKKLADDLKRFMKVDNTSLEEVQWGGVWGGSRLPGRQRFRKTVHKVMSLSQSPIPVLKNPSFPSGIDQQYSRLSPETAHHPPTPSTERTPLLSDTSPVPLEDLEEPIKPSFWGHISSFCRGFRKPVSEEPQGQAAGRVSKTNRKDYKWTRRLADKLRSLSYRFSVWIQIST